MSTLLTAEIWPDITATAKNAKTKCYVAVAYFGTGAAEMLPLSKGSVLVVDASEASVKSGQTDPKELIILQKKEVKIYSYQGLHAKTFVLGSKCFIGSANVSHRAASYLQEAVFKTTDRKILRQTKEFINSLCTHELGAMKLDMLEKIYRPPRVPGNKGTTLHKKTPSGVYVANLVLGQYPLGSEEAVNNGKKEAKKLISRNRNFKVSDFDWHGKLPFAKDDLIVEVVKENNARYISSPARVLHIEHWRNHHFVYLEQRVRRRKNLDKINHRINPKHLTRNGRKSQEIARQIESLWT